MIVMDACAACEITRLTDEGRALKQLAQEDESIVSCELIHAELASAFRKIALKEDLDAKEADTFVSDALGIIDEFYPLEPLRVEALNESIRLHHSTYDMFYFVLARRLGATLFTVDRKLMALCGENGVDCIGEVEF